MTALQPIRLLKINEVIDRTSLSRSTIYALIEKGKFPSQRKLGPKCSRWVESEIDAWTREIAA